MEAILKDAYYHLCAARDLILADEVTSTTVLDKKQDDIISKAANRTMDALDWLDLLIKKIGSAE